MKAGRLHEASGAGATAFALAAAAAVKRTIIWIMAATAGERLNPFGLTRFFDPARLILVETNNATDGLWAMEEALRSGAAGLVVGACRAPPDLTQSRRLQLAAEAGAAAGPPPVGLALIGDAAIANAAETRWRIDPLPSVAPTAMGAPVDRTMSFVGAAWRWTLTKNKRGPLGSWAIAATPSGPARIAAPPETGDGATHPVSVAAEPGRGSRSAA